VKILQASASSSDRTKCIWLPTNTSRISLSYACAQIKKNTLGQKQRRISSGESIKCFHWRMNGIQWREHCFFKAKWMAGLANNRLVDDVWNVNVVFMLYKKPTSDFQVNSIVNRADFTTVYGNRSTGGEIFLIILGNDASFPWIFETFP
jgi:hypothetical protein